jgi:hypothetical protein
VKTALLTNDPQVGSPRVLEPDAPKSRQPSFDSLTLGEGASAERDSGNHRPGQTPKAAEVTLAPGELEHVRQYLDNPNLRHYFLVSDPDGTAQPKVASVVEQTTHLNFYKITISQGIVIDPRHPDQAMVFALVVNPGELENLRQQLRVALNDRVVEEGPPDPRIITQLAEIGHVQAYAPAPLAEVVIPDDALAIKQPAGLGNPRAPARDRPIPEQEFSSPVAAELAPRDRVTEAGAGLQKPLDPTAAGAARLPDLISRKEDNHGHRGPSEPGDKLDQNLVVLVWVSRTNSG